MAEPLKKVGTYSGRLTTIVVGAAALLGVASTAVPGKAQAAEPNTPACTGSQVVQLDRARAVFDQFRNNVTISKGADSPIAKLATTFVQSYETQITAKLATVNGHRSPAGNYEQPFSAPNNAAFNQGVNDAATTPQVYIGDGPAAQGLQQTIISLGQYDITADQAAVNASKAYTSMNTTLKIGAKCGG